MKKDPRPIKKNKRAKILKVTPDISEQDLEMLEDAYDENIISADELAQFLI